MWSFGLSILHGSEQTPSHFVLLPVFWILVLIDLTHSRVPVPTLVMLFYHEVVCPIAIYFLLDQIYGSIVVLEIEAPAPWGTISLGAISESPWVSPSEVHHHYWNHFTSLYLVCVYICWLLMVDYCWVILLSVWKFVWFPLAASLLDKELYWYFPIPLLIYQLPGWIILQSFYRELKILG